VPCVPGLLIFIIYFSISEELKIYFNYCFISINNTLFEIRCYSFLVASGVLKNKVNLHSLFNFSFLFFWFNM
jgi:hypothetical protein